MKLTAEQIAKKVGLSNATVSRVLNNSHPVSPETRETVMAAVRKSGGVPRLLGRRPRKVVVKPIQTQNGYVEILMVNRYPITRIEPGVDSEGEKLTADKFFDPAARLATSYSRHIIDGIIDELKRFGIRAMVQVTSSLSSRELVNEINSDANQGLIMLGLYGEDVNDFIVKCHCPIVTFMTWNHDGWPDYVGIDNLTGIRLAFEHLYGLGHRKIGYIAGELECSNVFRERLAAYKTRMADVGLPYRAEWVSEGSCALHVMQAHVEKILSLPDRPTAIMCCFDGAAVAVKRAADKLGMQIPRELSVVGYDDEDIAELFSPPLTTIRVPTLQMGRQAVLLLMMRRQMNATKPEEGCSIRVSPKLIVRESTAAPAR